MRKRAITLALLSVLSVVPLAADTISIEVVPALAPNAYGSPSFAGWQANAVYALENGLSSWGTPGTPEYYQAGSNYTTGQVIVTGFPSWMGVVGPGSVFGAGYAAELGNRMTFGLVVLGNGTQFSISELSFAATSTDPANALAFGYSGGYDYSAGYVGLDYGPDGIKGTADDVWITSGPSTQLVNELYGRGSGNSQDAYCPAAPDPCTLAAQQAALDTAAALNGPYQFTATYQISNDGSVLGSGSATFDIQEAPEPGTLLSLGAGLALLVAARRRKRQAFSAF